MSYENDFAGFSYDIFAYVVVNLLQNQSGCRIELIISNFHTTLR